MGAALHGGWGCQARNRGFSSGHCGGSVKREGDANNKTVLENSE